MKSILILIFLILSITGDEKVINAQSNKFSIIFTADPGKVTDIEWLTRIAEDWGATGICLRLTWLNVDNNLSPGEDTWQNLDNAINILTSRKFGGKNLDIYVRISMGLGKPLWVKPGSNGFVDDDFQIDYQGDKYDHRNVEGNIIPETARYQLNFSSSRSAMYMKNFLTAVLNHLNSYPPHKKHRIKEVVPTFTATDEQEYPIGIMCGYSSYEIKGFQNYLISKYYNISNLNSTWNTKYKSFSKINPRDYNWWKIKPYTIYINPKGRIDWMEFRTKQLALFINSLAEICSTKGFKMGAQIGSLYDSYIEFRGWADPTILFEKVHSIHTADVYHYSPNFTLAANYKRSISKFWTITNKDTIHFSTETNWPGYNGQSPDILTAKWLEQLKSYYYNGASALYLVDWSVSVDMLNKFYKTYKDWRNALVYYSNRPLVVPKNTRDAVHMACEKVFYTNHNQISESGKFTLFDSLNIKAAHLSKVKNNNDNSRDIITNYMLEYNPAYIRNYDQIYLTNTSRYITKKASDVLKKNNVKVVD